MREGMRDDDARVEVDAEFAAMVPNFDSFDLRGTDEPLQDEVPSDEQFEEEYEEETRDDVLRLGADDLIAHDIWFVGVGASELDHAGAKAFIDEHRRDIRGAFLVNLDSIGSGELTLLTNEGMGQKRRADRRLARMLNKIAEALHIDFGHSDYSWDTTDATPAMQRSVRVSTIMGMSSDGVPALSQTADDEPEYLNDDQIAQVSEMLAELIRRA